MKKKKNNNYSYNAAPAAPAPKKAASRGVKIAAAIILVAVIILSLVLGLYMCSGDYEYVLITVEDFGEIEVRLDRRAAPITVENFLKLVDEGYYSGTTFHRIMDDFMIQGGAGDGSAASIKGEFSSNGYNNPIKHERGVISMARTDEPNSASSGFFICNATSPHLDGDYAAFGMVTKGMDVVDAITEYGIKYAGYNGMISDTEHQPVISAIKIIDK